MKRTALWIFAAVALVTFAARHRHHARAQEFLPTRTVENIDTSAQAGSTVIRVQSHRNRPVVIRSSSSADGGSEIILLAQQIPEELRVPSPLPFPETNEIRRKPGRLPAPPRAPAAPQAPGQSAIIVAPKADPKVQPEWFPKTRDEEETRNKIDASGSRVFVSGVASSEAKAQAELRKKLESEVTSWIAGDVPLGWKPPAESITRMIQGTFVKPVIEDVGTITKELDELITLYRAGAKVNFSPETRVELLNVHQKQIVRERMIKGGGLLAFVLVILSALSGYIRADEVTKGRFTNRLRVLTAAGVGAAGVVLYQMFV
jgi:hypothetical protein